MATVKLFGNLRQLAGATAVTIPGRSVRQLLDQLCTHYPALETAVFDNNQLRPHVRIMIAGRDIELDQGLETAVNSDDTLAIFPPIAGGLS